MFLHYLNESRGAVSRRYKFTIDAVDFLFDFLVDYAKYSLNIRNSKQRRDTVNTILNDFYDKYEDNMHEEFNPPEIRISYSTEYSYDGGDYDTPPYAELEVFDINAGNAQNTVDAFRACATDRNAIEYIENNFNGFIRDLCEKDANTRDDVTYDDGPDPDDYYERSRERGE